MNVYLDTSAVIKLYHREVGSDELLAFLRCNADDLILTVADITRTEFHSALTLLDRIAHQRGLRTLDAFQLAAALFCHQVIPVDTFVTSDHRFLKVAKDYFTIFNPEDKATP